MNSDVSVQSWKFAIRPNLDDFVVLYPPSYDFKKRSRADEIPCDREDKRVHLSRTVII